MTTALYTTAINLLPSEASAATLAAVQQMIAGQLQERMFLESKVLESDVRGYLDIRVLPFGVHPLLSMVEHYFMPGGAPLRLRPDVDLIKRQLVYTSTVQNDCGGLEKDLKDAIPTNIILYLARTRGQLISKASDLAEIQSLIHDMEALHDSLVQQITRTYLRLQGLATTDGERFFSRMMLDLCRRQLEWTLATPRYKLDGL